MKVRGKIVSLLASVLLATVGLGLTAAPAHAENTYPHLHICNSINSRGIIKAVDLVNASGNAYVPQGGCKYVYNANNRVRIDPDPENVNSNDVDSTWWAYQWQDGYPYCDPGEGLIDPPNYYDDEIYYNTDASGC